MIHMPDNLLHKNDNHSTIKMIKQDLKKLIEAKTSPGNIIGRNNTKANEEIFDPLPITLD